MVKVHCRRVLTQVRMMVWSVEVPLWSRRRFGPSRRMRLVTARLSILLEFGRELVFVLRW